MKGHEKMSLEKGMGKNCRERTIISNRKKYTINEKDTVIRKNNMTKATNIDLKKKVQLYDLRIHPAHKLNPGRKNERMNTKAEHQKQ